MPGDRDPDADGRERRVEFDGITNFRDLGGYPTGSGGVTRWGLVYRADALHKLTDDDLRSFAGLGIRVVYDLRGDIERAEFPSRPASVHVPIIGRPSGSPSLGTQAGVTTSDGETILRDMYVGILEHSALQIGVILRGLSDPRGVPAVFHCHGGKDRTGVVAAVLLLALGVDPELILDDYVLTREYRRIEHQQDSLANMLAQGLPLEAAAGVLGTPRWAMAAALAAIAEQYGGIDTFLTQHAGMSLEEVAALRETLVE